MLKTYKPKEPNNVMEVKEEQIPLIIEQKKFLERLLEPSPEKADYTEQPAAYLEDEPREFKERTFYLCLRGLRDGFLQFMQETRLMTPSEVFGDYFAVFSYQGSIETSIQKRLLKDPVIRKYLAWNNIQKVFEANCENIAKGISTHFAHLIREKELKIKGII